MYQQLAVYIAVVQGKSLVRWYSVVQFESPSNRNCLGGLARLL